ncbi:MULTISPECIES: hypothetical protein [unclassified Halorhabdus]|uniref:hypothetical protein n=1 Tax=unclassified Halorhabdus TaxID=2621901 RepID=UPI0018A6D0A9|nr:MULTISPECIES: hypothetical protein [unclassified Halorhabdus]
MTRNTPIDETLELSEGRAAVRVTVDVDGRRLVYDRADLASIGFDAGKAEPQ